MENGNLSGKPMARDKWNPITYKWWTSKSLNRLRTDALGRVVKSTWRNGNYQMIVIWSSTCMAELYEKSHLIRANHRRGYSIIIASLLFLDWVNHLHSSNLWKNHQSLTVNRLFRRRFTLFVVLFTPLLLYFFTRILFGSVHFQPAQSFERTFEYGFKYIFFFLTAVLCSRKNFGGNSAVKVYTRNGNDVGLNRQIIIGRLTTTIVRVMSYYSPSPVRTSLKLWFRRKIGFTIFCRFFLKKELFFSTLKRRHIKVSYGSGYDEFRLDPVARVKSSFRFEP